VVDRRLATLPAHLAVFRGVPRTKSRNETASRSRNENRSNT
jgi:hypothetical protein